MYIHVYMYIYMYICIYIYIHIYIYITLSQCSYLLYLIVSRKFHSFFSFTIPIPASALRSAMLSLWTVSRGDKNCCNAQSNTAKVAGFLKLSNVHKYTPYIHYEYFLIYACYLSISYLWIFPCQLVLCFHLSLVFHWRVHTSNESIYKNGNPPPTPTAIR